RRCCRCTRGSDCRCLWLSLCTACLEEFPCHLLPTGAALASAALPTSPPAAGTRWAFLPVNFSQRLTITSQYNVSSSIKNARRLVCSAAISVQPLPPNRSSTFSPVRDEY